MRKAESQPEVFAGKSKRDRKYQTSWEREMKWDWDLCQVLKLEGTSIENSMKLRAKRADDFLGATKKYTRQVKLATQLPRGQVSRKISVEHCM